MAFSDFWRDIAIQFRTIPEAFTLSAAWANFDNVGPGKWGLQGSKAAKYSFEALATRAGKEIADASASDLLTAWLDKLREGHFEFSEMGFTITQDREGNETSRRCHYGRIEFVCDASANFCKKLEADALRAEFDAQKQTRKITVVYAHKEFKDSEQIGEVEDQSEIVESETESLGAQLTRLRDECRLTIDELAVSVKIDRTNVYRHLADKSIPHPRKIGAYERVFSKILKRKIVIKKTPRKRH
jgi:hypothetical protein